MAVHAAGVHQDLVDLKEGRAGAGVVLLGGPRDGGRLRTDRQSCGGQRCGQQQQDAAGPGTCHNEAPQGQRDGSLPRRYAFFRSVARIGSRRIRFPVAAKIALATAGATLGTPGSPTPAIFSLLGTICVSTFGTSFIRSSL